MKRAAAIAILFVLATPTLAALPAPAVPAGFEATPAQFLEADRYRKSCRRKVRKFYGPARGRHTASIRLLFVEQCIAAGGRLQ